MMDCKQALTESEGDFEKAIEILRKKGQKVAAKRADREATEGIILAKTNAEKTFGALIVVNSETDFVAKNEKFIAFTTQILDAALANKPATLDELKNIVLDGRSIGDQVTEQVGIIGEKLDLSYYGKVEAETVVPYIHPGNKLASIVGFTKADVENQLGKDIAMQIAAMSPVAVNRESIPQHIIDKEHEIAMEKFRLEGKPEAMLDKIAMGAVQKWFSEAALLEQSFIKDNKLPRAKQAMLSDAVGTVAGAALGTSTVTSFIESAAGVEQGGRTGLTGLVVAALFLLALFFSPLIAMVGSYPPITAPALVIVGAMMIQNVAKVDWKDYSESVPAFLTMLGIPLSYSIADGLALGFISYPIIKLFSGKGRELGWLTYVLAVVLVVYFVFVRSAM